MKSHLRQELQRLLQVVVVVVVDAVVEVVLVGGAIVVEAGTALLEVVDLIFVVDIL
jgi:hypothetical protein